IRQRRYGLHRGRDALKYAKPAAHDHHRYARSADEVADARHDTVRPRKAEPRTVIDAIGQLIVARPERALDVHVACGTRVEAVAVETEPVDELQIVGDTVGITERKPGDERAAACAGRIQLPREGGGPTTRNVRKCCKGECS